MCEVEFYQSVAIQLRASQKSYEVYIIKQNFLNAKEIYKINSSLVKFIETYYNLITENDKKEFDRLLAHFNGWMNQFDEVVSLINPRYNDYFAFARRDDVMSFPRIFVNELIKRYQLNE